MKAPEAVEKKHVAIQKHDGKWAKLPPKRARFQIAPDGAGKFGVLADRRGFIETGLSYADAKAHARAFHAKRFVRIPDQVAPPAGHHPDGGSVVKFKSAKERKAFKRWLRSGESGRI